MKLFLLLFAFTLAVRTARAQPSLEAQKPLDAGFSELYELNFSGARHIFREYIRQNPDDPLGQVAIAASYLFEIFDDEGVFTSSFFLNNKTFLGGVTHRPDPQLESAFLSSKSRAREMAQALLHSNSKDPAGLYALTLADGMEADFDSLIAKRQLASVYYLHQASDNAKLLLAVDSRADDAYLALGAANYVIGCLPGYKRFFLGIGGIHGSRKLGMQQLSLAAQNGHYLQPFAKIMLALAALREHQPDLARRLLTDLHSQFPQNKMFASELAKLTPAN